MQSRIRDGEKKSEMYSAAWHGAGGTACDLRKNAMTVQERRNDETQKQR